MGIISSVDNKHEHGQVKYPYIGIFKGSGRVVLFQKPETGFVLSDPSNEVDAGYFCVHWAEVEFEPLVGKVTLSNGEPE